MSEEMTGYDIPETGNLTAEGATSVLNKITADVLGNPQHPNVNTNHPQHGEYAAAVTKLYAIKNAGKIDPIVQACNDAMQEQQDVKLARAIKTKGLVNSMVESGFADLPESQLTVDTPVWKQDVWKMQHSRSVGNHQVLKNEIQAHVVNAKYLGLKIPLEMETTISNYNMSMGNKPDEIAEQDTMSQEILEFLANAHGEQDRAIAKALKPSGNKPYVSNQGGYTCIG